MTDSLFTAPPSTLDAADGQPINTATTFRVTVAVSCTHHRFYAPTNPAGTVTARLVELTSDTTGTLLAEKVYASVTDGAPNQQAWDVAVPLVTGKIYRTQHHSSTGHYVATGGALTGDVTSAGGLLVAVADGSTPTSFAVNNGSFDYGAVALATSGTAGLNFHDDVVVVASGASVAGTGVGVLGGLAGSAHGFRGLDGSGVGRLGGLTGAATGHITPAGGTVSAGASWYDLLAIRQEARELRQADQQLPVVACRRCGTPLLAGPKGERYCPFDGLRY